MEATNNAILLKKDLLSKILASEKLKKKLIIERTALEISSKNKNKIIINLKQTRVKNKANGIDKLP